jgi:hypothetical protein
MRSLSLGGLSALILEARPAAAFNARDQLAAVEAHRALSPCNF